MFVSEDSSTPRCLGGSFGRNYEGGAGASNTGAVGAFSIACSNNAFLGASVEGAALGLCSNVNNHFYRKTTTPQSVINDEVTMPSYC